jgi:hypothetical protein
MALPLFHDDVNFWESAITIRLTRAYIYDRFTKPATRSKIRQPISNKSKGIVSDKAAKRLQHKIELLYDVARMKTIYSKKRDKHFRYKVGFLTLTLASPQVHTDKEIHFSCFAPFIRELRLNNSAFLYVWRAETQANGNIHYHICTNIFIHKDWVNRRWNYWQNKLGYVDRYGKPDPPSAKIQPCLSVDGLGAYMAKYMSKDAEGRRPVTIKNWDCSNCLKAVKTSDWLDFDQNDELIELWQESIRLTKFNKMYPDGREPIECQMLPLTPINKKQMPEVMKIWHNATAAIRKQALTENNYFNID